jgi:hypothetical protein
MRGGLSPVAAGQLNFEMRHAEFNVNGDTHSNSSHEVEVNSRSVTPVPMPEPVREASSDCRRTVSKILCIVSPTLLGGGLLFALLQKNMDPVVRLSSGVACGIISVASCVAAWSLSRRIN